MVQPGTAGSRPVALSRISEIESALGEAIRGKPDVVRLSAPGKAITIFGLVVALGLIVMKIVPTVPGHFTRYEWLALAVWCVLGAVAAVAR